MNRLFAAVLATGLIVAPALAQVDSLDRRGVLDEETEHRIRVPDQFERPVRYEGRARFSGSRLGKCPPYGLVRATVTGNRFDARIVFPIEFQIIRGSISGSNMVGQSDLGYTWNGTVTDSTIRATARKRATYRPVEPPRPGVPIPGPVTAPTRALQPDPRPEDCTYTLSLTRVTDPNAP